jgi:hypothetical protein
MLFQSKHGAKMAFLYYQGGRAGSPAECPAETAGNEFFIRHQNP